MTKFTKWKKWQKLIQGLYPNHMHISRPWWKHVQSFKKIGIKLYEELRSQGTHCLYTFIESEVRKEQSSQSGKKWQKLMQGLHPNHMHIFRPWRKHVQSFKKIGIKLYEELCSQGTQCLFIWGQKMTKFIKWKKWQNITSQLYPNHMHILIPWRKHMQSFKKIGTKL